MLSSGPDTRDQRQETGHEPGQAGVITPGLALSPALTGHMVSITYGGNVLECGGLRVNDIYRLCTKCGSC